MSPTEAAALITAFAAILGSLAAIFVQLRATHQQTNSRMTELVELTRKASLAEGRLAQLAEDRASGGPVSDPGEDKLA